MMPLEAHAAIHSGRSRCWGSTMPYVMLSSVAGLYRVPNVRFYFFFFFQAEDGIRDYKVTGVQTCALPIYSSHLVISDGGLWARARARCLANYSGKRTAELQRNLSSLKGQ